MSFPVVLEYILQKSYKIYFLRHIFLIHWFSITSVPTDIDEVLGKEKTDDKIICLESLVIEKKSHRLRHSV